MIIFTHKLYRSADSFKHFVPCNPDCFYIARHKGADSSGCWKEIMLGSCILVQNILDLLYISESIPPKANLKHNGILQTININIHFTLQPLR